MGVRAARVSAGGLMGGKLAAAWTQKGRTGLVMEPYSVTITKPRAASFPLMFGAIRPKAQGDRDFSYGGCSGGRYQRCMSLPEMHVVTRDACRRR
jgi:hypothetical protein